MTFMLSTVAKRSATSKPPPVAGFELVARRRGREHAPAREQSGLVGDEGVQARAVGKARSDHFPVRIDYRHEDEVPGPALALEIDAPDHVGTGLFGRGGGRLGGNAQYDEKKGDP